MATRGWIGYDWFKLIVAAILATLLIIAALTRSAATVAPTVSDGAGVAATAAPVTASTAVASGRLPVLNAPAAGGQVSAGSVSFNGTAEPGATVRVLVDGQEVGTAKAGNDGAWSLDATLDGEGARSVVVETLDASGATANQSAPAMINIVAAATAVPVPATAVLAVAPPTIEAPTALAATAAPTATSEATPVVAVTPAITDPADGAQLGAGPFTMTGAGQPGQQVEVLDGDRVVGVATVGEGGAWSLEITPTDATAAYSARPAGSTEPPTSVIRVTTGALETCSEIAVGCQAWVTREGGLQLRMRATPGTSAAIVTRLPIGTQMELTEGPQPADGFNWFKIRTEGGEEGWVAGEQVRLQPD